MEHRRHIIITDDYPDSTSVGITGNLGQFLLSPQVSSVLKEGFNRNIIRVGSTNRIELDPPLEPSRLKELGDKLVQLAFSIDSSAPVDSDVNVLRTNFDAMDNQHFTKNYKPRRY